MGHLPLSPSLCGFWDGASDLIMSGYILEALQGSGLSLTLDGFLIFSNAECNKFCQMNHRGPSAKLNLLSKPSHSHRIRR